MKDKFSVLMSVYYKENAKYLIEAIDSILNQTIRPSEIVIVCDGLLTSELNIVIDEYEKKYGNLFKVIRYKHNRGLGYALSIGLKECSNELVARMDTDDISVENRFELQLKYFINHPDCSVLGGQIKEFEGSLDNVLGIRHVPLNTCEINKFIKKRNPLNHMTVMYKKSQILNVGNYQEFYLLEDYFLWCRMYANGYKICNLEDILVYARSGVDMYKRRGGFKYFLSFFKLEKYKLREGIINNINFVILICERFFLQVICPNNLRGMIYKRFARKKS